jgi:dTMP kinase
MESMLFSVEGLDGSGKSTTAKYMGEYLTENGVPNVVVEAYPRDEDAMFKRDLWIQQKVPNVAVLSLILELRARVMKETIIPALLEGKVVITDRWHDTTWVYQHYGMGIPYEVMRHVFQYMFDLETFFTDLSFDERVFLRKQIYGYNTVHLDVSLETSRARVSSRPAAKDAFEKADDAFFIRLQSGFNQRYHVRDHEANPLMVIDANNDLEYVKKLVRARLHHLTSPSLRSA